MLKILKKVLHLTIQGATTVLPLVLSIIIICYPLDIVTAWISRATNSLFYPMLKSSEYDPHTNALLILLKRYLPKHVMAALTIISYLPYSNLIPMLLFLLLCGILASNMLIRSGIQLVEDMITKIPGLNLLYSYMQESIASFVGKFDKPVLITINKELDIQKIGFVTQDNLSNLGEDNTDKVAVYVPYAYTFSGELLFCYKSQIVPLKTTATQAWKVVFSGGIAYKATQATAPPKLLPYKG